jgi:hypothetical protein
VLPSAGDCVGTTKSRSKVVDVEKKSWHRQSSLTFKIKLVMTHASDPISMRFSRDKKNSITWVWKFVNILILNNRYKEETLFAVYHNLRVDIQFALM